MSCMCQFFFCADGVEDAYFHYICSLQAAAEQEGLQDLQDEHTNDDIPVPAKPGDKEHETNFVWHDNVWCPESIKKRVSSLSRTCMMGLHHYVARCTISCSPCKASC